MCDSAPASMPPASELLSVRKEFRGMMNRYGFSLFGFTLLWSIVFPYLMQLGVFLYVFFCESGDVTLAEYLRHAVAVYSAVVQSSWFSEIACELLLMLIALLCFFRFKRRYRVSLMQLLEPKPFSLKMTAGGLCVVCFWNYTLTYLTTYLIQWINRTAGTTGGYYPIEVPTESPLSILLSLLVTVVLAPIFEELLFRGVLLQPLRRYGDGFAVLVSSLVFGLFHANLIQIPSAAINALILGAVTVKSGSIWPAIFIHMLNNLFSALGNLYDLMPAVVCLSINLFYLLIVIAGLVLFVISLFRLRLPKTECGLSSLQKALYTTFSPGMLLFFAIVAYIVLSAFESV